MTNTNNKLEVKIKKAQSNRLAEYEPLPGRWVGQLGNNAGVLQNPAYPPGYVFVRDQHGNLLTVYNSLVPNVAGLFVIYGYDNTESKLLQVLAQWTSYQNQPFISLPTHGTTHTWPNVDTVYIRGEQFFPYLLRTSATAGLTTMLYGGYVKSVAGWVYVPTQTIDLTAHVPASGAIAVLVSVNTSGTVILTDGGTQTTPELITASDFPATPANSKSIAAVRLFASQLAIQQTATYSDIFDLRFSNGDGGNMSWRGVWSGAVAYNIDDVVTSGGSTYICILGHTNYIPPNGTYWVALGGSSGVTSVSGTAPIASSGGATPAISLAIDTATAKATPVGADEIVIGDSAATFASKKATLTNLITNTWGVLIAALTGKTTPVDADIIEIADSAASNATKGVTLTNLWLNYFKGKADALYQAIGSYRPLTPAGSTTQILYNNAGAEGGSANFAWDNANLQLIIGGAPPVTGINALHILMDAGSPALSLWEFSDAVSATDAPLDMGWRAGGTKASKTNVKAEMGLHRFSARGWDGSNWGNTNAQVLLRAVTNWSGSNHDTQIDFYTTPTGSTNQVLAASMKQDGSLDVASHKITSLINGTAATDAANVGQSEPSLSGQGDNRNAFLRLTGYSPTTHLNTDPGFSYASYTGFVTPTVDLNTPSIMKLYYNGTGVGATRFFAYKAYAANTFLTVCYPGQLNSRAGLRIDDGTNNNYVEMFLEIQTDGTMLLRLRSAVSGIVTGPTNLWGGTKVPIGMYKLQFVYANPNLYFYAGSLNIPEIAYITSTPMVSPTKIGFYGEHPSAGTYNVAYAAAFDSYFAS